MGLRPPHSTYPPRDLEKSHRLVGLQQVRQKALERGQTDLSPRLPMQLELHVQ